MVWRDTLFWIVCATIRYKPIGFDYFVHINHVLQPTVRSQLVDVQVSLPAMLVVPSVFKVSCMRLLMKPNRHRTYGKSQSVSEDGYSCSRRLCGMCTDAN